MKCKWNEAHMDEDGGVGGRVEWRRRPTQHINTSLHIAHRRTAQRRGRKTPQQRCTAYDDVDVKCSKAKKHTTRIRANEANTHAPARSTTKRHAQERHALEHALHAARTDTLYGTRCNTAQAGKRANATAKGPPPLGSHIRPVPRCSVGHMVCRDATRSTAHKQNANVTHRRN